MGVQTLSLCAGFHTNGWSPAFSSARRSSATNGGRGRVCDTVRGALGPHPLPQLGLHLPPGQLRERHPRVLPPGRRHVRLQVLRPPAQLPGPRRLWVLPLLLSIFLRNPAVRNCDSYFFPTRCLFPFFFLLIVVDPPGISDAEIAETREGGGWENV